MKKIVSVVGARPQFIKLDAQLPQLVIHTGQHFDSEMSQVFFEKLKLPLPKYNLACNQNKLGEMVSRLDEVYEKEKPDLVIVFGDANSTAAGALAAYQRHIPVAHVEAGLRSFNWQMLEEYNRTITDHIADLNFCPTQTAVNNLKNEGIKQAFLVGDVMFDRVLTIKESLKGLQPQSFWVLTTHRAENVDRRSFLKRLFSFLGKAQKPIKFPIHPRTQKRLQEFEIKLADNIEICQPLDYFEMMKLIYQSKGVITDSGGLQKEAYFLGKPCLIIRQETEWEEIVDGESIRLVPEKDHKILPELLRDQPPFPKKDDTLFGDGTAWKKIKRILKKEKFL